MGSSSALPHAVVEEAKKIAEQHSYDVNILLEFATYARSQKVTRAKANTQPKALTMAAAREAVCSAFGCRDYTSLKRTDAFQLAIAGRDLDLRKKDAWLQLYREWVAVPENERNEIGPSCINGIDVLKNFRPWQVFGLDPKIATKEDIQNVFRRLAKDHHPDTGGDPRVFEELRKMRDALLHLR